MPCTCQCDDWIAKGQRRYGNAGFEGPAWHLCVQQSHSQSHSWRQCCQREDQLSWLSARARTFETSPDKLINKACIKPDELDLLTATADPFVVVWLMTRVILSVVVEIQLQDGRTGVDTAATTDSKGDYYYTFPEVKSATLTHVDAGNQQFDNFGPEVTTDWIRSTASIKIMYLALSAIKCMDFTIPVRCSREIRGQLLGLSPYIAMKMLQTTVHNLIVDAMLPTREIIF